MNADDDFIIKRYILHILSALRQGGDYGEEEKEIRTTSEQIFIRVRTRYQ